MMEGSAAANAEPGTAVIDAACLKAYRTVCQRHITKAAKKGEMLLAHLARILQPHRLRLRLRGPNGARDKFLLAATAQDLRAMAKLIPMPLPPALA